MKKIILTAIIAFGALFCYGQNAGLEKINYKKSAVTNALQIKALDSRLKFIQNGKFTTIDKTYSAENYYIDMFEITNSFYNAFLNDLKNNNLNDLFDKCQIDHSKWKILSEAFENASKYYHTDEKYNEFPVVNITEEAAELFCQWLTKVYAATSTAKYKNATFTLPTENEWLVAAAGGLENTIYPWEGKFLQNKKGEWLANFKIAGEENIRINSKTGNVEILDNNVLYQTTLVPVRSYVPNNYGLYQMSGNAAELTIEGKVKGGSWHSYGYYMQIAADDEYGENKLPNPFTGFRVVMHTK